MNINSILVKFASQDLILASTAAERDKIDNSLSALQSKLKYGLNGEVSEFLKFGSYTRNTILPRKYDSKSDVDLMVIMKTTSGLYTANTYRNKISKILNTAYPNSLSSKDYPVVKLTLNHITFDIVPAYTQISSWSYTKRYYIPNKASGWQETVPNDLNALLSQKNQSVGNNIVRHVIRLCKHWNSSAGYPYESYLMEKQILQLAQWSWSTGNTYDFFLKTMNSIAGNRPGVRQALDQIQIYKGNWSTNPNEEKQFQWLSKLLPGLQYLK